jgi:phosphoserine phosphatase
MHFASVVLDVDSTISALEGIDWLAEQRDESIAALVAQLTTDAMESKVPLDDVYARRLDLIRPTRDEIAALSHAYIVSALPGVRQAIASWQAAGVHVVLVSGGLRDAILPLAHWLGVSEANVHAVEVLYADNDSISDVQPGSLLAQRGGKVKVVSALDLPRPVLAVGDGATDAELAPIVDRFIAFVGVVRRDAVVAKAAGTAADFAALTSLVLAPAHAD